MAEFTEREMDLLNKIVKKLNDIRDMRAASGRTQTAKELKDEIIRKLDALPPRGGNAA